jgi:hypothetical protein
MIGLPTACRTQLLHLFAGVSRCCVPQKLSRKLVHATAGPMLLLFWPTFRSAAGRVGLLPAVDACTLKTDAAA